MTRGSPIKDDYLETQMNRFTSLIAPCAIALFLSTGAYAADPVVTPEQIAAARTSADHEAIAAIFDQEAARLEQKVKEHEKMAQSYRSTTAGTKGANAAAMSAHCLKLSKQYAEAAKENRELAKEHRAMKDRPM
jgi:hypothetical protein